MELYVSFSDVMHFFRRKWIKFLLVVVLFGVVCSLLPLQTASYTYTANTTVMLNCQVPENADADYRQQYTNILNYRVQAAVAEASSNDLLESTADKLGIKKEVIKKITGEQVKSAPAVKLTIQTSNASLAAKISDTAAQILSDDMVQQFPSPKLSVFISEKALDTASHSQNTAMLKGGILGAALGFLIFVCYGLIRVLTNHAVNSGKGAAELLELKFLGNVPHTGDKDKQADAFRRMRTAVLNQPKAAKSLLVESTGKDSGTPQTAAGLAISLAQAGRTVLAVDADLRDPQLASLLGVKPEKNLRDVLDGRSTVTEAAVEVPAHKNLSLLAGAAGSENPADLLTKSFSEILEEAESEYDSVIICAPSQPDYPDADSIASCPNAVLLTAKYGTTSYNVMRGAISATKEAGGNLSGFVVTDA
ncbi:MAG: CpsD/CapB family tyrosine-protein kinase [Oscillospiraceae bacterium]|jgi:Mrp family chromosome partitioning ATPase|nr:CpsD/CapB family tyrosine-protein kinase [Oscillospiraceae bacterium]